MEDAEIIALKAITFLAADDDRLSRFMALTGVDGGRLPQEIATSGFQAATLEYLMADESLLLVFCETECLAPEAPGRALHALRARPQS